MRAALITLCLVLAAGSAQAQKIYRWVGPDGKVQYGDMPPATAKNLQPVDTRVGASTAQAPEAQPTDEEEAARQKACSTKATQLKTFQNASKLVEKDALGREREYTAEERQMLIERTQAEINEKCPELAAP